LKSTDRADFDADARLLGPPQCPLRRDNLKILPPRSFEV